MWKEHLFNSLWIKIWFCQFGINRRKTYKKFDLKLSDKPRYTVPVKGSLSYF